MTVKERDGVYEKVRIAIPYEVAKAELGTEVILGSQHPDPSVLAGLVVDHFTQLGVDLTMDDVEIVYPEFGASITDYSRNLDTLRPDYEVTAMVRRK